MTWDEAIQAILAEAGGSLHYAEISERIIAKRLRGPDEIGATPAQTVNATINSSLRQQHSPYIRVRMGEYALRSEIEASRQRGWFLNKEESLEGVVTLSSAFAWNGLTYIVTIAGPNSRIEPRLDWMAGLLVDACSRLEMRREVA